MAKGVSSIDLLKSNSEVAPSELPKDWVTVQFQQAVLKGRPKVRKIKSSDYSPWGAFPIIDQGQDFIGGYADDRTGLYQGAFPVIIFGDHTRIFKYIDFPFLAGADGTQILLPNTDEFDPRFLYYALSSLDIPSRGYNRHFSLLKEKRLPKPPLPEQRAIAHVLRSVQQAKAATNKVMAAARQLKQSLMRHLFTYGPVAFDQADQVELKETEIGQVPSHWDIVNLDDACEITSGGTPSKKKPEFWLGPIPWASPKDMKAPRLWDTEDHVSEEGLKDGSRLAPSGTIFVVVRGMILARDLPIALTMVPMAFNQDMKAILSSEKIDSQYLLYAMSQFKHSLKQDVGTSAHGTRRIGTSAIQKFRVPLPPKMEQQKIAGMLAAIDGRMHADEAGFSTLTVLFQSALHDLMTAKVRVPLDPHQLTAEAV